jgi:outer membrane receptor protein involved in Fe transport
MFDRKTRHLLLAVTVSASTLAIAHAASSQQAAPQAAAPTELNEVVVTAQKRTENLQDVPATVSVVSQQLVAQLHATRLSDIAGYVPGLVVTSGGTPGESILSLRGIYPVGSGTTVGTYIDDIPVGGSSLYSNAVSFSLDMLPYDVARVEVLSGPQGTLYGASTLGGLVKYALTPPPLDRFRGEVGGDILGVSGGGSIGGGARAEISAPLIRDQLGFVASYAFEDTPGYIDNARLGTNNDNATRQQGGRVSVLWKPTDRFQLDLTALYQRVQADNLGQVALDATTLQPIYGDLKNDNYLPEPFRKEISVFSVHGSYDFHWATLSSTSSYQYSDLTQVGDDTAAVGPFLPLLGGPANGKVGFTQYLQLSKFTEELRLASPAGQRFEWLLGGFFDYEHSRLGQTLSGLDVTGAPLPGLNPLETFYIPSIYREDAAFGDVTFHVTSKLDIAGGLRLAYNNQNFQQLRGGTIVPPADDTGKSSESVLTYSFNPSYHFNRNVNLYLRIASGYQPGGPNVALPGVPPTVKSDTLTNYEVGLKTQWPSLMATFNIDAFYVDWNNIQVGAESPPPVQVGYITNGGKARSEGVEAEGSFSPLHGLRLAGTFAYVDARLTQVLPSSLYHNGSPLPQTPRYSGSVRVDYTQPISGDWTGHIGAAVHLRSSALTIAYEPPVPPLRLREPGFAALDLNADVSNGRYTLRLFVKNLTDKRGYDDLSLINSAVTGAAVKVNGTIIEPRTIGVALDAKF